MVTYNVCVTGGAGFIGSNLTKKLLERGDDVTVLDNLDTGREENIREFTDNENFKFVKGTIVDFETLKDVFEDVDYVFHEAALSSVSRSTKDPISTNEINVSGTLNVLNSAVDAGVKKVIAASSSSVYGDTPELPKVETMRYNPLSPYAVTKVAGELYMKTFYEIYGLGTVALRYFNVYGPKQDPSSEYAAVIPKFISCALENRDLPIEGDGKQTRDFTYVDDAVDANILAMRTEKANGKVFNIAYGERASINELAGKIIEITNSSSRIVYGDPRPGDVKHSLADITLAKKILGYSPKYDLDEGLEKAVEWFEAKTASIG